MRAGDALAGADEFGPARYAILFGCSLGLAVGYSSTYFYSSGLFMLPVAHSFGLSRGEAALGPLVCTIGAAAIIPLFGRLLDRIGAIPIALGSLLGLAVGYAAMAAFATGFAGYLACSLLIAILGAGSTALPFSRLVVLTFAARRGLALGVMLTGTGIGAMVLPLLLVPAIRDHGWRATYGAMALAVLAASVLIAALILPFRSRLATAVPAPAGTAVVQADDVPRLPLLAIWTSTRFLLIGSAFFAIAMAVVSVVVHAVPLLTEAGVPLNRAASLAAAIGFASIAGRLLIGSALDRVAAEPLTIGLLGLALVAVLMLAWDASALALPGCLILGLVVGAEVDMLAFFTARFFRSTIYGTVYGGLFALFLIGGALGPALSGYLYDLTGSYRCALLVAAGLLIMAMTLTAWLRRYNSRVPLK